MQIGKLISDLIMSLVIELFSTGVSKTLDGVKSANVKNNLEQEIQKYFDLHEDIVDLQLDTFLSKTNVLREMVQFLIDHKNVQLYKGAAVKEVVK